MAVGGGDRPGRRWPRSSWMVPFTAVRVDSVGRGGVPGVTGVDVFDQGQVCGAIAVLVIVQVGVGAGARW